MHKAGLPTLIRPSRHRLGLLLALLVVTIAAIVRWWPHPESDAAPSPDTETLH
jgi:hypothetical protein